VALIIETGIDPDDMEAAHGPCNNYGCVNPKHLSWKTHTANQHDRFRDDTCNTVICPIAEQYIHELTGVLTVRQTGQLIGRSYSQVAAIRRGDVARRVA